MAEPPFAPCRLDIAVVGTPDRAAFADAMLEDIATALADNGAESELILADGGPGQRRLAAYMAEHDAAGRGYGIVDLNGNFQVCGGPGSRLARKFSYVVDHPVYHLQKTRAYRSPMTVGYADATHAADHAAILAEVPAVFMPHGGPPPLAAPPPMAGRDVDFLFLGNIQPLILSEVFNQRLGKLDPLMQRVVAEAVETALGGGGTAFAALMARAGDRGIEPLDDLSIDGLIYAYALIENTIASIHRLELLQRLSGFRVHVVGEIPGGIDIAPGGGIPGSFTMHGYLPFDTALEMIGRTRVLLNMNPQLIAGSHERVWQGMAMGAVVLTNPSLFLRQFFTEGVDILYTGGELAPRLAGLIGDAPRLQEMAERARGLYAVGHTWKSRVLTIIETFNGPAG